jgi:hypothetical protein
MAKLIAALLAFGFLTMAVPASAIAQDKQTKCNNACQRVCTSANIKSQCMNACMGKCMFK